MTRWGSWLARALIVAWLAACVVGGLSTWTDEVPAVIATAPAPDAPPGTPPVESEAVVGYSCAAPLNRDRPARQRDDVTVVTTHGTPCSHGQSVRTMVYVDVALAAIAMAQTVPVVRRRTAMAGSRAWRVLTGRAGQPTTSVTPPV